jgi:hypothetical protein
LQLRLYVQDPDTNEKIFIDKVAQDKKSLVNMLGSTEIRVSNKKFSINDVKATANENTATTMALGGVVGILGGVPGVILGSAIGGLIGKSSDDEDKLKANIFNKSSI